MGDAKDELITVVDGIAVTDETPGFSPSEMTACPRCAKPNAPNRFNCLYCGTELKVRSDIGESTQLRPSSVEPWERVFNVVHLSSDISDASEILAAVRLDESVLTPVLSSRSKLPLVRVSKLNEAEAIATQLERCGIKALVVSDIDLLKTKPPVRLRAVEFGEDAVAFVLFNSSDKVQLAYDDVKLLVSGSIYERRTESTVLKKDKTSGPENETATVSDFGVLDIYAANDDSGYRISTNGFDFSCLGNDKELVATQNLQRLASKLEEKFTSARFDKEYRSLTKVLDLIWPPTTTNDSKGLQRIGFKVKRSRGEIVSNAEQFTKYSRLQAMHR